jgi:Tol biopolymer transport system component
MAVYSPTLSPDGSRLAYVEGKESSGHSLWVSDVDGTDRHRIVGEEVWIDVYSETNLQWSPDGTRLVFGGEGIHVVDDDGSALTRVARGQETAYWSPDGSRIAFQRFGTFYTMAPDGRDIRSFGVRPRAVVGPWNPLVPAA